MKVSLLGDSIRLIGYGKRVPELLGAGVEVYQPEDNCRYAKYTLRGLFDWQRELAGSDVIHFNCGLWDTCTIFGDGVPFTPVEEYVETVARIAELLLRITPNVIFATTTPVIDGQIHNANENIEKYNAAVTARLRQMGVKINDLHATVAADKERYVLGTDKVHLTDEGIEVTARQVADCIAEALGEEYRSTEPKNKCSLRGGVLVLTDLEGISGVSTIDAIPKDSPLYREACENLMKDTNTAVAALFDGGATEVYVNDGHGGGDNFIKEMLDPRAVQVTLAELTDIMDKISCVVLVGAHAMSGTKTAFLDHTQSSARIHRYYYNGRRIGEMSQIGFFAGYYGVPCVAVTGDEAVCREAKTLFPGVACAAVKTAVSRNLASCLESGEAQKRIYSAILDGYRRRAEFKPYPAHLPLEVEVEFHRADYCDEACEKHPELVRLNEFTVRSVKTEVKDYLDVLILWG